MRTKQINQSDGQIDVDSVFGKLMGFTSDRFRADESWLWRKGKTIYLSMIWVTEPNMGYTQNLIESIHKAKYKVKVPTPLGAMNHIVQKMRFERKDEMTDMGRCEVWVLNEEE